MKTKNKLIQKLLPLSMVVFMVMLSVDSFANNVSVSAGLNSINSIIRSQVFGVAVNILYAICGVVAIVGTIHVYSKWSSGDPNTTKIAASWVGALIFVAVSALVIRAMTGL
jgi:hypothetical protein